MAYKIKTNKQKHESFSEHLKLTKKLDLVYFYV